jgi:hypothetical protein
MNPCGWLKIHLDIQVDGLRITYEKASGPSNNTIGASHSIPADSGDTSLQEVVITVEGSDAATFRCIGLNRSA